MADKKPITAKVTAITPNFLNETASVTIQDGADSVSVYFGTSGTTKAEIVTAAKARLTDAIAALDAL